MKKVMLITQHFPPEIGAASNRVQNIIEELNCKNIKVFVVTSKPSYPNTSLYKDNNIKNYRSEKCYVYRSPVVTLPISEKKQRIINMLLFLFYALIITPFLCFRHSVKVCITTSPPFTINFIGLLLKIVFRRYWILEARDLWPDSMIAVDAIKKDHTVFKLLKGFELLFYRNANRIVVVTNKSKQIIENQGISENKIFIVTNGIPNWIPKKLNLPVKVSDETFNICYIGNVGLSQNLKVIIDAAAKLQEFENIHVYIVGEGLNKIFLKQYAKQLGLNNVYFINGITERKELAKWYLKTNIGIVSLRESPLYRTVIPSKIFEYAAFHIPILFIGSGEAEELIKRNNLGETVQVNSNEIAEKIINIYQSMEFKNYQTNEEFLLEFSWKNLIEKYIEVIQLKE